MPLRRDTKRRSLDEVLDNLAERFLDADVYAEDGTMTGLAAYMADLSEYLREELRLPHNADAPTAEAMTALGIPPSEWYRLLLNE